MVKFYEFVILAREAKAMLTRMGSIFLGGGSLPLSGYLAKGDKPPWLQYAATPSFVSLAPHARLCPPRQGVLVVTGRCSGGIDV